MVCRKKETDGISEPWEDSILRAGYFDQGRNIPEGTKKRKKSIPPLFGKLRGGEGSLAWRMRSRKRLLVLCSTEEGYRSVKKSYVPEARDTKRKATTRQQEIS